MLTLSRRVDEIITIGEDIEIMVVRVKDGKVWLGIAAPREIEVHRKEVRDAIRREGRRANLDTPAQPAPYSPVAGSEPAARDGA